MSAPALPEPPHSTVSEVNVLGGLLVADGSLDLVGDKLRADDFYEDRHRVIYEGIRELAARGTGFDVDSLCEHLRGTGRLEGAGGERYVRDLQDKVPTAVRIEAYAEEVVRQARRRNCAQAALEIHVRMRGPEKGDEDELGWAEQRMFEACQTRHMGRHIRRASDVLVETLNDIERLQKCDGDVTGLGTGHWLLDQKTAGLQPGDLNILAGRPSMGKTAKALQMAWHAATTSGEGVIIFSIETKAMALLKRLLSFEAQVDGSVIRIPNRMEGSDYDRIIEACGRIEKAKLWIDDSPLVTTFDIRSRARRLKARHGLALIVIDYLQIIRAVKEAGTDSRERAVATMIASLKACAKELDVPVLCLSQLNRDCEKRSNKRPNLGDLRESGAIEQDADLIMFLYRGSHYYPNSPKVPTNHAELIVGKNRNGPVGTIPLLWVPEMTAFYDWDEAQAIYPKGKRGGGEVERPDWMAQHPAEPPERENDELF